MIDSNMIDVTKTKFKFLFFSKQILFHLIDRIFNRIWTLIPYIQCFTMLKLRKIGKIK